MPREPDRTVRLVASGEVADEVVSVVGDQVLAATPADVGKVVTVASDGTLTLAAGGGGVTDHGNLTGLADDDHPYVLETLIDAAADLIVGTAADTAGRLAKGSALNVLRVNAAATALEWAAPAASGYNPIPVDDPANWSADLGDDQEFSATGSALPTGWSWVNQGAGTTYAEAFGAGVISDPAHTGNQWRALVRNVPAASPWVATAKLSAVGVSSADFYAALLLRESSSGKLMCVENYHAAGASNFYVERWTNPTTFATTQVAAIQVVGRYGPFVYMRIRKNSSTSWDWEVSGDGVSWYTLLAAHDLSAYMTPNQIGFGLNVSNNNAAKVACHFYRARGA